MTGGGFGGCVLALVEAADVEQISHAITRAYAAAGYRAPSAFAASPATGPGACADSLHGRSIAAGSAILPRPPERAGRATDAHADRVRRFSR